MIHAYDKLYLDDAMQSMGEMIDYAANSCLMDMDDFFSLFLASGLAAQFSTGSPKIISGMSGTELAIEVLERTGAFQDFPHSREEYSCSPEYWCGWILAYYQWYTNISFHEIMRVISLREIKKLYPTLHEAAEEKFVDTVNHIVRRKNLPTKLQVLRQMRDLSQRELAVRSGVHYRSIQQYEQRTRDINKAAAATVASLASVIGCKVEDLLEYDYGEIEEE